MPFLAPWFLAGLAAVGVPIYLHLLRRHKSTPVPFSSLMFFERRTQSSIKHRRIRYWLLLALRLALLVLLALAFANPYINRPAGTLGGDRLLVVAVDESFSMRAGRKMDEARAKAIEVLASRKPGERAQVMALGSTLRVLTQPVQDTGELRAAVETIRATDSRGSYAELARALRSMAQSISTPIEVHLISDMQKTALPAGFAELQMPANARLELHPVGATPAPNWAVENVNAPALVWEARKARVQATVGGYATPDARRTVSLVINGRLGESKTADVPAGGRAVVEFQGLDIPHGFARCEVRIDSADQLAGDDRALFAVERSDPQRVLFVHEARDSRSPLYFRSALASAAEAAFALEAVTVEHAGGLQPARYAFVVISDVLSLPETLEQEIRRYVRSGGSVLVAAGPATARRPRVPVFDEAVLESRYYSRAGLRFLTVGEIDPSHPSIKRAARWEGVKFYHAVRVQPGQARVLASLTDQTPLLLEKRLGEGRVLLFASGLDNLSNDFPLHPVFVPFVEQTARYLAGTEQRGGARVVGSFLELRTAQEKTVGVEVIDPDGLRPLSLKEAVSADSFQLTREGFYEVRRANGRHEMVAANPDRRESDLATIPEETLALWRGGPAAESATRTEAGQVPPETVPFGLWWYPMLLALAAAVAESTLASRYLGVGREEGA